MNSPAFQNTKKNFTSDPTNHKFHLMNPANLLKKFGIDGLTPAEEAELSHELSQAYHMDESSASSRDVQRIAEKIRARLQSEEAQVTPS